MLCTRVNIFWPSLARSEKKTNNVWNILLTWLEAGLWNRSPSNFVWPEPITFWLWKWTLKFGFRFHSPWLWGQRSCTN